MWSGELWRWNKSASEYTNSQQLKKECGSLPCGNLELESGPFFFFLPTRVGTGGSHFFFPSFFYTTSQSTINPKFNLCIVENVDTKETLRGRVGWSGQQLAGVASPSASPQNQNYKSRRTRKPIETHTLSSSFLPPPCPGSPDCPWPCLAS